MASRYWVTGGNGNWSSSTNWSATSGGSSGAAAPTSADDVFVNALSGTSPVITVDVASSCLSLDFTGAVTPTLVTSTAILSVFGNLIFIGGMTNSGTNNIQLAATSVGKTITTNGLSLSCGLDFNGVGGGWTLQDNLVCGILSVSNGTLNTNNKTVNCTAVLCNLTSTRSLTLGTTVLTCSGNFNMVSTGLTLSAASSTITMTGAGVTFDGAGQTYGNVNLSGTSTLSLTGSNTFSAVTIAAGLFVNITAGTTQTLTNIVSNGVKGNRAAVQSASPGSAVTISTASAIVASNMTIKDATKSGAGTIVLHSSQNVSGNTGITFLDRYWVAGTGNTSLTSSWSYVSGGAGGAPVPTSSDIIYFDSASFSASSQTVTIDATLNCLDMDWTGATNSPTLAGIQIVNVYGNLTFIAAMTVSNTGSFVFQATSAKNITTAGKSLSFAMSFNSTTGDWTFLDSVTNTAANGIDVVNGILRLNAKTIVTTKFTSNYTTTRTIDMSNVSITCSSAFTIGITGLTLTVTGSTITISGNTQTFAGGGGTYNIVNFTGTPITITGSNTFNTLNIAAGKTLKLTSGTTQTATTFLSNGTTANPSTLQAVTAASPATIALPSGRYFIRHTSIKDITITGATAVTSIAGTNVSGNTGITFVTKFEMGRVKNDGSFNWYSAATGSGTKLSG